jgi:hypothetical protein
VLSASPTKPAQPSSPTLAGRRSWKFHRRAAGLNKNPRLHRCRSLVFGIIASFFISKRVAYATTGDDQFGVLDLNTGVFTQTLRQM